MYFLTFFIFAFAVQIFFFFATFVHWHLWKSAYYFVVKSMYSWVCDWIWLVTSSMKTIFKDKLCGVKIKKIRLLFLKGQRFKNVFFFSNCPAISLTVENLVICPSICLSTTTTTIITKWTIQPPKGVILHPNALWPLGHYIITTTLTTTIITTATTTTKPTIATY